MYHESAACCDQHMNLAENEVMRNGKKAFSSQQITLFIAYAHAYSEAEEEKITTKMASSKWKRYASKKIKF